MKFGIAYEISVPRPWTRESEKTVYDRCLEQVKLADQLGFDFIWAVEHHFLEEYSHCSSPELFLTAVAIGNEISCRVGSVSSGELHRRGFHPTGLFATFGVAYLAGKLLGLDANALARAAGILTVAYFCLAISLFTART